MISVNNITNIRQKFTKLQRIALLKDDIITLQKSNWNHWNTKLWVETIYRLQYYEHYKGIDITNITGKNYEIIAWELTTLQTVHKSFKIK